jgi:hypothetical protein
VDADADASSPHQATGASRSWSHIRPLYFRPTNSRQLRPIPSYRLLQRRIDDSFDHRRRRWSKSSIRRLASPPPYKNAVIPLATRQRFFSHRKSSSWMLPQPPRRVGSSRCCHSSKKCFNRPPPSLFYCRWAHKRTAQPFQSVAATGGAGAGCECTVGEWRCQVHLLSMVDERIFCPWLDERGSHSRISVLFK